MNNPLLIKPNTPFETVAFSALKTEHFLPALKSRIEESKSRIEKIKKESSPNFQNCVLELEFAHNNVSRVAEIFSNLEHAVSTPELKKIAKELFPLVASFSNDVSLDDELFQQIKKVYDSKPSGLNVEDQTLLENTYKFFVRNGALLDAQGKEELREIDKKKSELVVSFNENVLNSTNAFELLLQDPSETVGLPKDILESAHETAKEKGKEGWLFNLQAPSFLPLMKFSERRDLREKIYRAYTSRATASPHDNRSIILELVRLKHQRARLLGFESHADFTLSDRMAKTTDEVKTFLGRILKVSKTAAKKDVQELQTFAKSQGLEDSLQVWDFSFYSEKLRKEKFHFDEESLKPYFKLENVVEGVFKVAGVLYSLDFKEREDIPRYHDDVRTFEVSEKDSGELVGIFYTDFFPRESKKGGAWMTNYREQGLSEGELKRPHVSIVCNFTKPSANRPSLLTLDEVRTLFHEFGHALHSLLSKCRYPSVSGTNVLWDFVELPSQLMENWVLEKEALDLFAKHYETGEPLPSEWVQKIKEIEKFQIGYASLRQVNFGLLDLAWHSQEIDSSTDVFEFERRATQESTVLFPPKESNISCGFSHIFGGGYSAGYYSYKWAEALEADAFELFKERGIFDSKTSLAFKTEVLSKGGTDHPMKLYQNFRGRKPDPDALLRRDGLI